jgi:xanthine/CO dehydrogenase XdhC/CoxF family maturation factor
MLFTDGGEVGTVSGGCLESDLRERITEVLKSSQTKVISYDTTTENDLVLGTGMGCGGIVDILLEPTDSEPVQKLMSALVRCYEERVSVGVATVHRAPEDSSVAIGDHVILIDQDIYYSSLKQQELVEAVTLDLKNILSDGRSTTHNYPVSAGTVDVLLEHVRPPYSLLIFGAGDDAQPVCTIAAELGWQVTVVDNRDEHLTQDRFPEAVSLVAGQPGKEMASLLPEKYDAVVIMTHNYMKDLELLRILLPMQWSYLGLLGASRRADRLLNELMESGVVLTESHLLHLHAPVGLDLGSDGPYEIALSIIAEIQSVLSGGTGRSLGQGRQPSRPGNTTTAGLE